MIIDSVDLLKFNKEWQQVSKKEKTDPSGKVYHKIKYETHPDFRHGLSWKIGRLFFALVETLKIVPLLNDRKNLFKLWKSCFSGIESQIVRVYKQIFSLSPRSGIRVGAQLRTQPVFAQAEGLINPNNPPQLEQVTKQEILALQSKIQTSNPRHSQLILEKLDKELFPFHKFKLGDVTYYVCQLFNLSGSNVGVLVLVQIGDKVFPQVGYESNSQATWRIMPAVQKHTFGAYLVHLGKGHEESDTELPISLNVLLHRLMPAQLPHLSNLTLIVDNIKTGWDRTNSYGNHVTMRDFCHLVEGAERAFCKAGMVVQRPPTPECILLPRNRDHHPDFGRLIWTKEFEDRNYGKISAKVFASKDKTIQYLFYELEDERAFLASAERVKDNPINGYGLRHSALKLNACDMPILEHIEQIPPGFEPKPDAPRYKSERYFNNWNFIRELEIIKCYYSEQKRAMPPKV